MDSILTSVKKMLGITAEYEQFDIDIIMHINSVFFILEQLGIGPDGGFSISDRIPVWNDFYKGSDIEAVKSYMYLKVRLLFDPPSSSIIKDAMMTMINEFEWRLNVEADNG